jgi:hypothetical protein
MSVPEFFIFILISGCLSLYCYWIGAQKHAWLQQDTADALERIRERLRELEGTP